MSGLNLYPPPVVNPAYEVDSPITDLTGNQGFQLSLAQQQMLFTSFGSQSSAYFNFQARVEHFGLPGIGFLSYAYQHTPLGGVNIVFTNPVVSERHLLPLMKAFLHHHPLPALFVGVEARVANCLKQLGFSATQMGRETSIDLTSFSLSGKAKKQLRHAANLHLRSEVEVAELGWHELNGQKVCRLSERWRQHKQVKDRELRLLTRPPVYQDEWGVRKFYAFHRGELVGFAYFDPYYQEGRLQGYCANIIRQAPDTNLAGLLDFILLQAAAKFRSEGVPRLSLGIAPMYKVDAEAGDHANIRRLQQFCYRHANQLYAFQALAYHKSRYRGQETPWYFCSRDVSAFRAAWALFFGTGVLR